VLGCKKRSLYAEAPSGPQSGRTGAVLAFTSSATDPGHESVAVRFDWGDGDTSDWSAWLASGDTVTASHSWSAANTYSVRAQAKNVSGVLSDWSGAFAVTLVNAWTQTFGGTGDDEGFAAAASTDGGYVVAGRTASFGAGSDDVYIVKTDASGNQVWARTFDGGGADHGCAVQPTLDGGFILAGQTAGGGGGYVYLIKTDADGNKVWDRTYGANGGEMARSVQRTSDGGYVVAGATASTGAGSYDVYLLRAGANGDTMWTRTYGGVESDVGYSVQVAADGGFIIAGETDSYGAGGHDVWLIKTDSQGNVEGK
jgi:hypothetical protein